MTAVSTTRVSLSFRIACMQTLYNLIILLAGTPIEPPSRPISAVSDPINAAFS